MNDVQKTVDNQTPIEIALGIDENGMTTVSKLYDFLQMSKPHYARWYKNNIIENQFAEENVDYFPFTTNGECGGQASSDSKITASFAKKLSMQQKNERGEQARNYFVGVEDKAKDLVLILKQASGDPMKLLKLHYEALEQVDKKVEDVSEEVQSVKKELKEFKETLPLLPEDADEISDLVKKRGVEILGGKQSSAYNDKCLRMKLYVNFYSNLKYNFNVRTYKAIKRNQKAKAIEVIQRYEPPFFLAQQIESVNAQQTLDLEGGVR